MPYIGNDIQYGELNSQTFTGDGSTTAFTLTYTVSNVNSLLVTVADVIQEPATAYTVSGTTLTFTSAPANSDTIHVRYLGRTLDVGTTAIVQDSDQDTKIQVEESPDEDTIRFDTGGTERVTINSTSLTSTTPLYIPDGSASAPSVTNTGDTNTGIFFPAADTVGVAVGGTEVWRYGSNPTTAKNLLINGAMTVSQRGTQTGQGGTSSAYSACDRWQMQLTNGGEQARFTTSQDTDVPAGSEFGYSLKVDCTTAEAAVAVNEAELITQRIEAQNLQHLDYGAAGAKTLVLSWWMKSPKNGTHCVSMYQRDANKSYVREVTVTSVDTWEKFTVTFPGDTAGTINNDNGSGLEVSFPLLVGSNYHDTADAWAAGTGFSTSNQQNLLDNTANNFYITGVQLEVGSVATDFEHEDYGTTLAKCQRYFLALTQSSDLWHAGYQNLTSRFYAPLNFAVEMRAAPSATSSAASTFALNLTGGSVSGSTVDAGGLGNAKRSGGIVLTHATSGVAGDGGMLQFGSGAYVHYSAEL
jgi:hypothetical protein